MVSTSMYLATVNLMDHYPEHWFAFFRNDELQEGKLIFCREKFSSENELV